MATLGVLQRFSLWTWETTYQNTQNARMGLYARMEKRFPLR